MTSLFYEIMYWNVIKVETKEAFTLWVKFADGTSGYVKFLKEFFTGVFAPLSDPDLFKQVFISHGAVAWPGELDIAPDTMYREIKNHGQWILT